MGKAAESEKTNQSWYSRATLGQKVAYWIFVTPMMGLGFAVGIGQILGISHTDIFPQSSLQATVPEAQLLPEAPSLHPGSPPMETERDRAHQMAAAVFEQQQQSLRSGIENSARLLGGTIAEPTLVAQSNLVDFIYSLDGEAIIVSAQGAFLGVISSDRYHQASTCNRYGQYGSRYASTSIWNRYGDYGSRFSEVSAYNTRTETPPAIVYQHQIVGFVTQNPRIEAALDPNLLFAVLCQN